MRFVKYFVVALLLAGCSHFKPFGGKSGNLTEVSVYAPAGMSQAQIQEKARQSAAITTVNLGYEKYEVVDPNAWDRAHLVKLRNETKEKQAAAEPTTSLTIKMYKAGEQAPANAVDAKSEVTQSQAVFK